MILHNPAEKVLIPSSPSLLPYYREDESPLWNKDAFFIRLRLELDRACSLSLPPPLLTQRLARRLLYFLFRTSTLCENRFSLFSH